MQSMSGRNSPSQRRESQIEQDVSPMLMLARRIREEQGIEQVKAFLRAMTPFAAPNELKRIGEGFGIPYERIRQEPENNSPARSPGAYDMGNTQSGPQTRVMPDQLNMIRTLMQLQGLMKGGGADMSKLMSLMGGGAFNK